MLKISHFKTLAVAVGMVGYLFPAPQVMLTGLMLFGHTSVDRAFGFGLKYADDFKHTHLGYSGEKPE